MPEEMKLIQPAPVVRDEYGMFAHPDMPDFDEGDGDKCKAWVAAQRLQVKMVSLEYHSDEAVRSRRSGLQLLGAGSAKQRWLVLSVDS